MPQASDERRATMGRWFGDPISEQGPIELLENRGYTLTRRWGWRKPVSSHTVHVIEWECIAFLIEEWDFGGIEE